MTSEPLGETTSSVEVTNVSQHGFWIFIGEREVFASFRDFPWFEGASIRELTNVELPSPHHLHWPELDVDLAVDSLDHPERYPLVSCRHLPGKGSARSLAARIVLATAVGAAIVGSVTTPADAQPAGGFVAVTDAMLQAPAPEDWLTWRRTTDSWGYSPLDRIDRDNVGDLRMVWSRGLTEGFQSGTPLAYDGVLYMPNPNDVIQAIDAATGDLIWEHRRDVPDDVGEYVFGALASNNRNIAIYDRLIIDTSVDDHVFALDAATGEMVWETQVLDYRVNPATQGAGPIIADGKAVSGRSCSPRGGPEACVVVAHDALTGEEVWRRRLIPGPGEPGDETWGGVPFEERFHVGAWMVPSYDPALDLVYVGTSVTAPAPKFMLGGVENQHLYHNSTLALDGDTGAIAWYYQHLNGRIESEGVQCRAEDNISS